MASREGHAGVVKVLLEAGADKDLEDEVRTQLRILCPSRDKMLATLIRQWREKKYFLFQVWLRASPSCFLSWDLFFHWALFVFICFYYFILRERPTLNFLCVCCWCRCRLAKQLWTWPKREITPRCLLFSGHEALWLNYAWGCNRTNFTPGRHCTYLNLIHETIKEPF